ncbi:MAG: type VI secretion system baseplate subunit TssF, partial [Planctomycetaceae bacterium]
SRPTTRPVPIPGPIAFGRGLEVTLHCDEAAFEGSGCFVLASVLEQFFAGYASINSFTETVLTTSARGEVHRWTPRIGRRETL